MLNFVEKHRILKIYIILYADFISRVLQGQNLLLLCHSDMSVNLRCGNGAMPEYLLYVSNIYILFKKKRGE